MKKRLYLLFIVFFFSLTGYSQTITTIAGTGAFDCSDDGGLAIDGGLGGAQSVAVDMAGNVYVSESNCDRIRKINTSGIISTIAGDEDTGYSHNGAPATSCGLHMPTGVTTDRLGNVYIADNLGNAVRKVNTAGVISTVAGTGMDGYNGDNIPATSAQLDKPYDIAVDGLGNVYIGEMGNRRVRKVSTDGIITTVAGNGDDLEPGVNGQPATAVGLGPVAGVAVDASGNLYVSCYNSASHFGSDSVNEVFRVNAAGVVNSIAGTGAGGYSGEGGPATAALLSHPTKVATDNSGNVYIADMGNNRIRKIDASGIITTFAGNGTGGFSGDNGPAASCELNGPAGIAFDADGNMFVADKSNERIRRIANVSTAVNALTETKSLAVYPNPAANEVTISYTEKITNVAVYDIFGQVAYLRNYNAEQVQVNVADLPAGVYLVKVNGTAVRRFVKD